MYNREPVARFFPRRACAMLSIVLLICFAGNLALFGQESERPTRRVVKKVDADYPLDLQRARIGGVVRLDVVVTPGGLPDKINVVGGNPILVESAVRAVKKWKWAPGDSEVTVRVNVTFDPNLR